MTISARPLGDGGSLWCRGNPSGTEGPHPNAWSVKARIELLDQLCLANEEGPSGCVGGLQERGEPTIHVGNDVLGETKLWYGVSQQ